MEATPYFVAYHTHNPSRPLAWRWMRAQFLAATGRRGSPRKDDGDTLAAVAYLRAQSDCRDDADRARLARRWPDIAAAERLFAGWGLLSAEVCARILAGQTDQEVAEHCGLCAAAIRWFESLFFCVRDRLRATDWIVSRALGPGLGLGLGYRREDLAGVWMAFGYFGGPEVLDTVIAVTFAGSSRPTPPGCWCGDVTEMNERLRQSVRRAVEGMMIPRGAGVRQLAQVYERARRRERRPVRENVPTKIAGIIRRALDQVSPSRPASPHPAPAAALA